MKVVTAALIAATLGCEPPPGELELALAPPPPPLAPRPVSPLARPEIVEPAKVELGKSLFNDTRLSSDKTMSCASCHDVRNGGDDGRAMSVGVEGRIGRVNAPTVLNAGLNFAQFWDGRAASIDEQVFATVQSPVEMDGDWDVIVGRLRADERLRERFDALYADGVTANNIVDATATYVRALVTVDAPFDRFLQGDEQAIGADAREGYRLFGSLGCVSCHQGRNLGGNLFQRFGVMGDYFADRGSVTEVDYGRYNVTGREIDRSKFKVPTLRNIAATAPYFHDGSGATLEEAVAVMAEYQLGRPATAEQVAKIVAFLESLSGELDEGLL